MPAPRHRLTHHVTGLATPLDYHAQRLLHGRRLLRAWLRRWSVYGAVAMLLFAAGTSSPLAVIAGALGALALPMLDAVRALGAGAGQVHGQGLGTLAAHVLAYSAVGLVPVLLTRPLWWPSRWVMAERALPLSARALASSDLRMLAWVLLPTQALPLVGALALGAGRSSLWHQGLPETLAALLLSSAVCALLAAWVLRQWRGRQRARPVARLSTARRAPAPAPRPLPAWRVVLWWPLRRGRARRSAVGLVAAGLTTPTLAAAPLTTEPVWAGVWLAALALAATAGLRSRLRDELAPFWQALRGLPVAPAPLQRQQQALSLVPLLAGLVVAVPVLVALGARPGWLLAWAVGLALAGIWEAQVPPPRASDHALRWLFNLVLVIALGSAVMP